MRRDLQFADRGDRHVRQQLPVVPAARQLTDRARVPDHTLADDAISGAFPLPFTFNYDGGSTASIILESNGNVWLQPPLHASFICDTSPTALVSRGPVISAYYNDLDPSATGGVTVHFDVDPSGQSVYCMWDNVPIWTATPPSPRPTNTFQVALHSSGMVELRYQGMDATGSWTPALVGYSPGLNNLDPGSRDLSASLPFLCGPDTRPLGMTATGRPTLGNGAFRLNLTEIPTGSSLGALILGFARFDPPLPLASLGMPGCFQHVGLDSSNIVVFSANPMPLPIPVPNNPRLAGQRLFAQRAAFAPGVNPLGVLSSNAIDMTLHAQ